MHINNLEHLFVIYIVFSPFTHTACPDQSGVRVQAGTTVAYFQPASRAHGCLIKLFCVGAEFNSTICC